jgi:hypothetical protein
LQPWCANRPIAVQQFSPGAPKAFANSNPTSTYSSSGLGCTHNFILSGGGAGGLVEVVKLVVKAEFACIQSGR